MVLTKVATSYATRPEAPNLILRSYREILKALSRSTYNKRVDDLTPWRSSPAYRFLKNEFLNEKSGAANLIKIYTRHLDSLQTKQALQNKYKGKGERTIEESAGLVGLKLPKTPSN